MQFRRSNNLYFSGKQRIILFGRNIIWMTTRSARAKKTILFVQSCYLYFLISLNSDYFDEDVICTFYYLKILTISTCPNYLDVFLLYMLLRGGLIVLYPRYANIRYNDYQARLSLVATFAPPFAPPESLGSTAVDAFTAPGLGYWTKFGLPGMPLTLIVIMQNILVCMKQEVM